MQKKKLKKRARERAARTGESYTTALQHVVQKTERSRNERTQAAAEVARKGPAKGAVSEEKCIEKTGYGFDHWFAVLDHFGGVKQGHTASARHLREDHGVSAWYSQSITVIYGRARGMRELNQNRDGAYQVSVSRVLPVSVQEAVDAVQNAQGQAYWMEILPLDVIKALSEKLQNKSFQHKETASHIRFRVESARFELRFTAKKDGRSTARVTATHLSGPEDVEEQRRVWRKALDHLRSLLNSAI